MPIYEYECQTCKHRFERFQTITAKPLATCPRCKGRVRRLLGAGSAVISKSATSRDPLPCGRQAPCCGTDSPCVQGRRDA